jgi:16S rRNA C967 or C1407 C5-methylase (RsmB/RsmF family)/NOL1/NOP2/fmu family ribosome biogenesis protein
MPEIPQQLLDSLSQLDGFNKEAFIDAHREENKITSIRFNPFKKPNSNDIEFELSEKVLWTNDSYYLNSRPAFTFDPLFHAGCYYVQEAGSLFIEYVLKQTTDFSKTLKVLDLCASPGGKSTLVNSLLNKESLLVANEIIKSRAEVLAHNLGKWGTANTIVTNNDPLKYSELKEFFDVLIVDAPCSGSGLFRKQPDAIAEWSENSVMQCSIRQKKILESSLNCLKDGGILIYSTCSYSVEENEDIVNWLVNTGKLEQIQPTIPTEWGIINIGNGYRFYPHLTKSEGFFCAVLRKNDSETSVSAPRYKLNSGITKAEQLILNGFVNDSELPVIKKNNQFHLLNQSAFEFFSAFEKQFYFKKAGTVIGEIKGSDLVPNQDMAWSTQIQMHITKLDLDKENALKFLRKEAFNFDQTAQGLVLINYKNFGIGWAKILANRVNNYLPNELRVLSKRD